MGVGNGNLNIEHSSTATTQYCWFGDFELESEPTTYTASGNYLFQASTTGCVAAIGDTYTNNGATFTVVQALTNSGGALNGGVTAFIATGTGAPSASGTLTRATGSGTASINFSSVIYPSLETVANVSAYIPVASGTTAGIVDGNTATWNGVKTFSALADVSATAGGIKVESIRTSPSNTDTQNVYSGTYTPTFGSTGGTSVITVSSPWYYMRVGNMVTVMGYASSGAGTMVNPYNWSLPITPTAFTNSSQDRSECQGMLQIDGGVMQPLFGSPAATVATTTYSTSNTGLRFHFSYRIA